MEADSLRAEGRNLEMVVCDESLLTDQFQSVESKIKTLEAGNVKGVIYCFKDLD